MAKKLLFHGNDSNTVKYKSIPLQQIAAELKNMGHVISVDTETNVVDSILERQLKVISFSDLGGEVNCVVEWDFLSEVNQRNLLNALKTHKCVFHNSVFDIKMFKKYGVQFENTDDTYLREMVLDNGLSSEEGAHGLQAVIKRRLDIDISKSSQLTFGGGEPYTDEQVAYAAIDTMLLGQIYLQQEQEILNVDKRIKQKGNRGLKKTAWWEAQFAKVLVDMETTGILIDKDKWYEAETAILPIYQEELKSLNAMVLEEFQENLIEDGFLLVDDTFDGNIWSSSAKKLEILQQIFPGMEKTAKTELKKYLLEYDIDFPEELIKSLNGKKWNAHDYPTTLVGKFGILKLLIARSKENEEYTDRALNQFVLNNFSELAIEKGWLIPAGTLKLNWGSPVQRLKIFRYIDEEIPSTGKEILEDYTDKHPLFLHYLAWIATDYSLKMFGKIFYDKWVDLDGRFRSRFKQILKTGRLGSVQPMLLNIPNQPQYRESIITDEGFKIIGADYGAEEVLITATLAGQQSWLDNVKHGYDLHSRNADLIYGGEWVNGALDDCAYYAKGADGKPQYQKCKCPEHQEMRQASKATTFLYFFGGTKFKLAFKLKISEDEAEQIIESFKRAVPNIEAFMQKLGNYAIKNGHIIEPVFGRIRFVDKWRMHVPEEHGAIIRFSKNFAIQASGSAILKIALVLLRRWINQNNYQNQIRLLLPYHDEVVMDATSELTELAKEKLEYYMELAAKLAGFDIGADAVVAESWGLAH